MFAKRLIHKALRQVQRHINHDDKERGDMEAQIAIHYGIPYASSILAYDAIQGLLAIGTLDGRIKIVGGNNIEGLLISPKRVPYKYLQFLQNHGIIVAISNENEIQVWNLEFRQLFCCLQWEVNITAFAVAQETNVTYLGDENGSVSILKYDIDDGKLKKMPYNLPVHAIYAIAGVSIIERQPVVGVLPQPFSFGSRILLAYEKGLLVLWDIAEDKVISVRGSGDLQMKSGASGLDSANEEEKMLENEVNEICSLCWASNSGSLVAVGYINGDILLWNVSSKFYGHDKSKDTSSNVVKLQLASGNRRLPVIVLQWSPNSNGDDFGGQLYIYGGDDMGSEEVLTVLSLEWSSGLVRCISRTGLKLDGSFADMLLVPHAGSPEKSHIGALFVLTNPGQLNVFDGALLSVQKTEQNNVDPLPQKFPVSVPTIDPDMTCAKLYALTMSNDSSKIFLKKFNSRITGAPSLSDGAKWPITGGVPSAVSPNYFGVDRIYIAGYQDGSVRIWDATFPTFRLMFVLGGKVSHIDTVVEGKNYVSALAFCAETMNLAVGGESGLVRIYKLHENTEGSSFHFVSEAKKEVHIMHHGKGFHCNMAFLAFESAVRTLQYVNHGDRLAAGFENGQVVMFDMNKLSVIYSVDCASGARHPVVSISYHGHPASSAPLENPVDRSGGKLVDYPAEVLICLTKDTRMSILDSTSGAVLSSQFLCQNHIAMSMYVIDRSDENEAHNREPPDAIQEKATDRGSEAAVGRYQQQIEQHEMDDGVNVVDATLDSFVVLCCEDTVIVFGLTSILKNEFVSGSGNHLHEVKVARNCWSAPLKSNADSWVLLSVNQNGAMEIRSLPELELLAESSLMAILRWSFKTGMEKTMCSSNGHISLVSGSEVAIISLLDSQNDFRIPQSLPSLHDKEVAAAAEAAIKASKDQRKKQDPSAGVLSDIVKVLRARVGNDAKLRDSLVGFTPSRLLEMLLSRDPFEEADISDPEDLNIDDIEIDDIEHVHSVPSMPDPKKKVKEEEERQKLFEGSSGTVKPQMRTTQEILTKYKFGGDAAAAAAHARDKLVQRQEKLDRISQRTAELQSGAENFADLAHQLAKKMENKKWWQL